MTLDSARTQAVLTVRGLAPLPASQVYEVWLIPAHGMPTGVAFLSPNPANNGWTAVVNGSLAGYDTIAATNEPVGGSPAPTGSQVSAVTWLVLRRPRRSFATFLRNRGEHPLDPGVVHDHALRPFAIALTDPLPLGVGNIGLGVHLGGQTPRAAGVAGCRRPRAIATLTAAAAHVTAAPPAIASTRRSSPTARSRTR